MINYKNPHIKENYKDSKTTAAWSDFLVKKVSLKWLLKKRMLS